MKKKATNSLLLCLVLFFAPLFIKAQSNIKYGPNYVVFEAEDTSSPLDLWTIRVPGDPLYHVGTGVEAINQTYLEFTGNTLNGGTPKSPLTYTFTCPKTATYRVVMRMYQPLSPSEAGDKRNDVWIKLTGNYTTANVYPKSILDSDHKFWGRGVRKWGTCYNLEAHVNGVKTQRAVLYNLIAGESYTFTMSGRSQGCSIDYILFYENSLGLTVGNDDLAANNDPQYRPFADAILNVSLDTSSIRLENIGDTYQLNVTVKPDSAPDKSVNWTSADPSIATVDSNGLVTAVSVGSTIVSVTTDSIGNTAECEVIVGKAQTVQWSAGPLSGESEILTEGNLMEAINFAGGTSPTAFNTTVNGVPFVGTVNNRTDNVWESPTTTYFSANSIQVVPSTVDIYDSSIGLPVLDNLLSQFLWTNGIPTTVTFSNLTVGETYKIQFLAADTRADQAGSYIVLQDTFGSPATTTYTESIGLSIIGEFTAIAPAFSFTFSKTRLDGAREGINLNAYQLRQIGPTSIEKEAQGLKIYPNPANDHFLISSEMTLNDAELTIFKLDGQKLYQSIWRGKSQKINVADLSPGIYLIEIKSKENVFREKLIVR